MPDLTRRKAAKPEQKQGRTASKEVRRHQLIEATIESISKHGISGTTMTTVTGFAGLSIGLVNFHFRNKETLFEETLRFLAEEHREQWRKNYNNAALTPQAKLLAIVDAHFHPRICTRKKLAVWFGFYGEARYRAFYRRLMSEIDEERWDISRGICRTLIEDGGYANAKPEDVADTLEGLYDGLCLNILIYPGEFSRETAKQRVRDYLARTFPLHFDHPETDVSERTRLGT
ncbi:TetR/AcrR family transcriptional regulator [Roseovarius aestuariivivens]|uniref:TetR/AcrR family transcriptional regulator n=1 Tax=Roseovarius aestuariivivens TaxID=1888910 RepID=UPI001081508F|nr:TetR/AcrR family transcriptional regulator [Roseovarius aestuariivivens]